MTKIKKTKKAKAAKKEDLYLDIYLPCESEIESNDEEKNLYSIPIRKEKFSFNAPIYSKIEQPLIDVKEETLNNVEEIIKENKNTKLTNRWAGFRAFNKKNKNQVKANKKENLRVKPYKAPNGNGLKKKMILAISSSLVVLAVAFIMITLFFNKVTISIVSQKGSIEYSGKIFIDAKINESDLSKNIIKGIAIEKEKSVNKEFEATGKVTGGAKAKGKIVIYNAFNTSPQILVQNTRFESPDGLIFRLDNRTTVPGGTIKNGELIKGSIEVMVTADSIGEGYNIDKVRFVIPGFKGTDRYLGFYAESLEKFSGGSSGESTVVSENDLKNAAKNISDILVSELEDQLNLEINNNQKAFKETIVRTISSPVYNVKAGDSVEKFTVEISGKIKAMVFEKSDYQTLLKNNISKGLSEDEELFGEPTETIENIKLNDSENQVEISLTVDYPTKKKIDSGEIFNSIKGQKINEVKSILLDTPGVEKANIKL